VNLPYPLYFLVPHQTPPSVVVDLPDDAHDYHCVIKCTTTKQLLRLAHPLRYDDQLRHQGAEIAVLARRELRLQGRHQPLQYKIAEVRGDTGDWDVVAEFEARNDDAANEYAEENYAHLDWYVLDENNMNING